MVERRQQPESFLKLAEVCRRADLGKSMIHQMIKDERFPRPYKLSSAASRWSEQEIAAWIDDVECASGWWKRALILFALRKLARRFFRRFARRV